MLLLILTNVLILFDTGINVEPYSLVYLNGLFLIIFAVFFIWRYKKETSYYKTLLRLFSDLDDHWFESIPSHGSFSIVFVFSFFQQFHNFNQTKLLKINYLLTLN